MQAGDYSTAGVPAPITRRVFVNGVHRHHVADSWDAEIGSDLPDQVSAVTGIKARTGKVTFAPVRVVDDALTTPLRRSSGWPPARGDVLTIQDEAYPQRWTRATARVTSVRAGLGEGEVEVDWSDDLDSSLSQITELPPVAKRMPGEEITESGMLKRHWHRTAIEPWGIAVEAFEDAGMRLLPSIPDVDFYALFQGSVFPRIGRISQAYSTGDLLEWDPESGFQYLAQWSYFTPAYESRDSGDCFTVYLRKTRGGPDAQTRWTMNDGSELRLTLQNSSVALSRNGTVIAQRGFTSSSPLPWVGASIAYDSVTFFLEDQTHSITYADRIPSGGIDWDRVRVLGAACLAVSYVPRAGWPGFNWPSLQYRGWGRGLVYNTDCTRAVEPQTVRDLLDEIASATLTGYWLDEHGILQWAPSNVLEGRAPAETITTRSDVLAGSWVETGGGVASTVVASYEAVALTSQSTVSVVVGEATSGKTMSNGDVDEEFVGPGADEEWIEPDMSPLSSAAAGETIYNDAMFSVWGGSYVSTEGEDGNGNPDSDATTYGWAQSRGWLSIDVENLTPRRWLVTHSVGANSTGEPAPQVQLVVLPNSKQIPVLWRDTPLPIWRARGRASFTNATYVSRIGPSWAPAYEHGLGAWGSRADARRVGDYLGERMSTIQVVLSELDVIPDPRRQLGDVVEVNAQGTLGGSLRCLVVGIHESSGDNGVRQSLDLRVIRSTPSPTLTYADLEASAATYAGPESRATYSEIEEGS